MTSRKLSKAESNPVVRTAEQVRRKRSIEKIDLLPFSPSDPVYLRPDGSYIAGPDLIKLLEHVVYISTVAEAKMIQVFLTRELDAIELLRHAAQDT